MPLYEYKCKKCGEKFEAIKRITEKDEAECPECGAVATRQMSSFALGGTSGGGKSYGSGGGCFSGG